MAADGELGEDDERVAQLPEPLQVLQAVGPVGAQRLPVGYAHGGLELEHVAGGGAIALAKDHHAVRHAATEIDLVEEVTAGPSDPGGEDAADEAIEGEGIIEDAGDLPVDAEMLPPPDPLPELG